MFSLLHSLVKYGLREHTSDDAEKCYIHKTTPMLVIQCELSEKFTEIHKPSTHGSELLLLIYRLDAWDKLDDNF